MATSSFVSFIVTTTNLPKTKNRPTTLPFSLTWLATSPRHPRSWPVPNREAHEKSVLPPPLSLCRSLPVGLSCRHLRPPSSLSSFFHLCWQQWQSCGRPTRRWTKHSTSSCYLCRASAWGRAKTALLAARGGAGDGGYVQAQTAWRMSEPMALHMSWVESKKMVPSIEFTPDVIADYNRALALDLPTPPRASPPGPTRPSLPGPP